VSTTKVYYRTGISWQWSAVNRFIVYTPELKSDKMSYYHQSLNKNVWKKKEKKRKDEWIEEAGYFFAFELNISFWN
jgi:hypothetical protein